MCDSNVVNVKKKNVEQPLDSYETWMLAMQVHSFPQFHMHCTTIVLTAIHSNSSKNGFSILNRKFFISPMALKAIDLSQSQHTFHCVHCMILTLLVADGYWLVPRKLILMPIWIDMASWRPFNSTISMAAFKHFPLFHSNLSFYSWIVIISTCSSVHFWHCVEQPCTCFVIFRN